MSQKKFNTPDDDIVPIVLFFQKQGLSNLVAHPFEMPKLPDQINLPYPPSVEEQQREALFKEAQTDATRDAEILKRLEELAKQTTILPGPKSPKP